MSGGSALPVVVVGGGARGQSALNAVRAAGVTDVALLDSPAHECDSPHTVFDDDSGTWELRTVAADVVRAAVVIDVNRPAWRPWIPNLSGRNDFRGDSFHAATWDPNFHAAGKHIAVIGGDSCSGHQLRRVVGSARSVTVYAHAPRRIVTEVPAWTTRTKRRLRRRDRRPQPGVVAAIESITATGVRTTDGIEHPADAIIFGTGFCIPDDAPIASLVGAAGITLKQAWEDGMEPFFGVAVHGFPNYFFVSGPDTAAQERYVAQCIALMKRTGSGRIEVRHSSQQVFNERAQLGAILAPPVTSAFELSSSAPDYEDTYDGAATLEIGGVRHPVRVRLIGHLDPLDGNYHWQGTVFDALPEESLKRARSATLSVGQHTAPARIVEKTPWGTHSVAGVGAPPYAR